MSSWADASDSPVSSPRNSGGAGGFGSSVGGPPRERPRLQLKPRSAEGVADAAKNDAAHRKSNPFGAAKPREEVLAQKGVDAKLVDSRIEKKAEASHFTKEQEDEVETVRAELTRAEEKLREANEMELPEEEYRVACEEKKKELNELMAKFAEMNVKKKSSDGTGTADGSAKNGSRRHYERPSERRRRMNEGRGSRRGGYDDGDNSERDDTFKSFGNRNRRSGGSLRGEGGGSGRGGGSTGNPLWD